MVRRKSAFDRLAAALNRQIAETKTVKAALADLVAAADNLKRVKEMHRKYPSAENASRIVEYERDFDAAVERSRKVMKEEACQE